MIKFFRRIRQRLLRENPPAGVAGKISRYLIYAIGEIVLVVIGILIALQINNWNQNQIKKQDEHKLLNTIKVDFQQGINTLERLNFRRDESIYAFNELIRLISDKTIRDEKHIDSLIGKSLFTPTYNGKFGSLSVLLSTGKIDIISDDVLRAMLLSWPQEVEDMTEGEIDAKTLTNGVYNDLLRSYVSVNDILKNIDPEAKMFPYAKRQTQIEKDYQALFSNPKFENLITQLELYYIFGKRETGQLIKEAKIMVETIDVILETND